MALEVHDLWSNAQGYTDRVIILANLILLCMLSEAIKIEINKYQLLNVSEMCAQG